MQQENYTSGTVGQSLLQWLSFSGVQYETAAEALPWPLLELNTPAPAPVMAAPAPQNRSATPSEPEPLWQQATDLSTFTSLLKSWKSLWISKMADKTLLGRGISQPAIMVIAECPDKIEESNGEAFSGPSHGMVLQALKLAGFPTDTLYMTYLSKWRPPGQRSLEAHEIAALAPVLAHEIRLIAPKAILCLGDSVVKTFAASQQANSNAQNRSFYIIDQHLNTKIPLLASQKAEFLVKNPSMKKPFWFQLLRFAAELGIEGHPVQSP